MNKFTRYANLTPGQSDEIVRIYNQWVTMDGIQPGQAVSIAARDALLLTDKQWNGKIGADAFAAALACLVMRDAISIEATVNGKRGR